MLKDAVKDNCNREGVCRWRGAGTSPARHEWGRAMNQIVYVAVIALLAGGCMNAGYNYDMKVSHVGGNLSEKGTEVAVAQIENANDCPLWTRIPSYLTLTVLPLYVTQCRTYNVELKFPDGEASLEVVIKGHGFVSFFPTGLLPIPGWFKDRAWSAGGRALIGGDCGMMDFIKMAIEESTCEWLNVSVGDATESKKDSVNVTGRN